MLTVKTIDILNHEDTYEVEGKAQYSPESAVAPGQGGSVGGFDYTPETVITGTGYERGNRPCVLFRANGVLHVKQYGRVYVMSNGSTVANYQLRTYQDAAEDIRK